MSVLLENFKNLKIVKKKRAQHSAFLLPGKGLHSRGDMSRFIQTVFHVQLGKEAFWVSSFPSPTGEMPDLLEKTNSSLCGYVLAPMLRPIKPRTPFLQ